MPAALRDYERQRTRRTFPIAARSWVFGALLQIPLAPVRYIASFCLQLQPGCLADFFASGLDSTHTAC